MVVEIKMLRRAPGKQSFTTCDRRDEQTVDKFVMGISLISIQGRSKDQFEVVLVVLV